MSSILGTSLSGLMSAQRSLETTSHNIANVNTEGYSRQSVDLRTRPASFTGAGYIGQGVDARTVTRSYDQFVTAQFTSSTSVYGETNTLSTMSAQIDAILSSDKTGIAPAFNAFFNAVNEVADDPSAVPVRQVMLSEADSLAQQLNTTSAQLEGFRSQNNNEMQSMINDINSYAKGIAELNDKVMVETSMATSGQIPNDLLDQRDALVAKLAERVNVTTLNQTDGSQTVFIGNGQALVLNGKASKLSLASSVTDMTHKDVLINGQNITSQISGGSLAGSMRFRDEVLDPAQQQFGLLAAGFSVAFNDLHKTGFDLNGDPGQDLFGLGTPTMAVPVIPNPKNIGTATAVYDPATVGQLAPSDYSLSYDGSDFTLTRLSDNTVSTFSGPVPTTIAAPGFTIDTDGTVAAGDSFLIRPTFYAAKNIQALIKDPKQVAAAGTGAPGAPVPGDNTVARGLAELEKTQIMFGGKSTFSDVYSQLVSKVGTLTSAANKQSEAHKVLLNQATLTRDNLSGVNLDEEAGNLIKFQNSYQASSKAIAVANSLFDSLLAAVR